MSKICPTPQELRTLAGKLRIAWGKTLNTMSVECAEAMENTATLLEILDKTFKDAETLEPTGSGKKTPIITVAASQGE